MDWGNLDSSLGVKSKWECSPSSWSLVTDDRNLPNSPSLKHFYSGVLGLAMGFFCFGSGIIHSAITALLTYIIVSTVRGPTAPGLVFLVTMGHLSISHMIRQYEDYGGYTLDYTGPQMILVLKLTSFAFNVYDGKRKDQDKVRHT